MVRAASGGRCSTVENRSRVVAQGVSAALVAPLQAVVAETLSTRCSQCLVPQAASHTLSNSTNSSGTRGPGADSVLGGRCRATHWSPAPLRAAHRTVLGKPDVYSCCLLAPASEGASSAGELSAVTAVRLSTTPAQPHTAASSGPRLRQVLLLDCPASNWQLAGVQDEEHLCVANTAALRASCNQW
jgi:hypothetical protein